MNEQHLLVDYENVQPSIEDLLMLAPKLTDVWLFHGPNQIRRAKQLQAAHERVTLVPHSGKGKNALDFHLSFYLGYVAAKHPAASLMVVANDKGYDAMIGHAKLLGFTATRVGFRAKQAPAAEKKASAPAKKSAVAKTVAKTTDKDAVKKVPQPGAMAAKKKAKAPLAKKTAVAKTAVTKSVAVQAGGKSSDVAKTSVKQSAPAKTTTAKRAAAKKAPAQKAAVAKKTAPAKKVTAKKSPAKSAVSVKPAAAKQAPAKATPSAAQKVLARAKTSLAKMGANRPTKFAALLRHLKSIVGQGATEADADALSHRLEEAKVIQVVGDLVLYP
jgi:hypothetical protein